DLVEKYLEKAMNLLETTISSGYRGAREVIALAYIRCLMEGVDVGITALLDLSPERGQLSWERVLTLLSEAHVDDLPAEGFALGVTDSASLTRLGTFSHRFLNDPRLTEALYRAAVRMDPHDPIAQTNLARFLVKRSDPADLREARRVIQLAQSSADRRFSWWRPVLLELNKKEGTTVVSHGHESESYTKEQDSFTGAQYFKQIRRHYNKLKSCEDTQYRGYELEHLMHSVSLLSCGFQRPSYRMTRPLVEKTHQIDTYIEHRGKSYRCECKWQKDKVSYDDMLKFADKIDAVGVSGLFISMSGFADPAINKSRELRSQKAVILVDGDEIDLVMTGLVHFDDLLNAKRRAFDSSSETYYPVRVSPGDG
ncbi:MAG: restriction endonuclease, partial [Patescibacteria group bacterium]